MTVNWPGKMVQWLKVFPAKSEDLSLVLGTAWWMERTEAGRLSSHPYILRIACTCLAPPTMSSLACENTHNNNDNDNKNIIKDKLSGISSMHLSTYSFINFILKWRY